MEARATIVSPARGRWALVTAARGADKRRTVDAVLEALRSRGVRVAGFVQEAVEDADHVLAHIGTDDRVPLGRRGMLPRKPTEERFCSFSFDRVAFDRADTWVRDDAPSADVLLLDEISKLEAAGGGHADTLHWALALPNKLIVVVVRAHQLFSIVERFELGDTVATLELPADEPR